MSWLLNSAAMNIGVHVSLSVLVSQVLVLQLCLTLCHPTDHSSVHGILQARIVEWIALPFSRGSSQPKGRTWVYCITGKFFTLWATREASLSQEVNGVLSKENTLFLFCFFLFGLPGSPCVRVEVKMRISNRATDLQFCLQPLFCTW